MKRPGIVIVTYNSRAVIGACLESLRGHAADVLVIDNASADGTAESVRAFSGVAFIGNTENRGFAGAVNQGMEALDNELVLLLNPDTELLTELDELTAAFDDDSVGAAAGKLTGEDGAPQTGFALRRFPTAITLSFEVLGLNRIWASNPVNRRYRCLDLDLDKPAAVDQPPGAFLMLRREVWRELGGFDEEFFPVWFEDVDLLRRLRGARYQVRYVPSVVARHRGGHSVNALREGCRQLYWYGSLLRYASKHLSPLGRKVVCINLILGSLARMPYAALSGQSIVPIKTYGNVIRLALGLLLTGRVRDPRGTAAAGTSN